MQFPSVILKRNVQGHYYEYGTETTPAWLTIITPDLTFRDGNPQVCYLSL